MFLNAAGSGSGRGTGGRRAGRRCAGRGQGRGRAPSQLQLHATLPAPSWRSSPCRWALHPRPQHPRRRRRRRRAWPRRCCCRRWRRRWAGRRRQLWGPLARPPPLCRPPHPSAPAQLRDRGEGSELYKADRPCASMAGFSQPRYARELARRLSVPHWRRVPRCALGAALGAEVEVGGAGKRCAVLNECHAHAVQWKVRRGVPNAGCEQQ